MPTQEELEWLQQQAAPPTSPSHMADLYHDGQIGYKTAFESIMSLLRQRARNRRIPWNWPGRGTEEEEWAAHARALLSRSATPIPDPPTPIPDPPITIPDPPTPIPDPPVTIPDPPVTIPDVPITSVATAVWMQNPSSEWRGNPSALYRIQVEEDWEVKALEAAGWSREDGDITASEWARITGMPIGAFGAGEDGEDVQADPPTSFPPPVLVWMQNPQEEWAVQLGGKPENLYRIQVREEQVDGLVDAGWSTEDEDMTASEWARLTQQPVGSAEYIKIWGDDAEEDDTISSGGEDPIGAFSRRTRFLSSIGQGGRGPKDPYEMYQAGLFNPLNRLFELKDLFGIALGDTAPEQETFFGRGAEFAKDPKSIYGQSRDILAQLLNLGKEGRRTEGVSFTPEWEGDFGQTSADISNEHMADLFHMALRSKTSRGTARRFASRLKPGSSGGELGIEQSLHEEAVAAGLTEQPFLEWIRDKYNLGSLLGV